MCKEDIFEKAERLALEAVRDETLIEQYKQATREAMELERAFGWKGKRGKMTQVDKMIKHMVTTGSITQREAYLDYNVQSFHRRLTDIREMGFDLIGDPKVHPTTKQEYTRYRFSTKAMSKRAALYVNKLSKMAA